MNEHATDGVRRLLQLEGLGVLLLTAHIYGHRETGWLVWFVLFLVPDLSLLGYLGGRRWGARIYNAVHTYVSAIGLAAIGALTAQPLLVSLALIWGAHIGLDRALGYGLKLPSGFAHTHLGRIGRHGAGRIRAEAG